MPDKMCWYRRHKCLNSRQSLAEYAFRLFFFCFGLYLNYQKFYLLIRVVGFQVCQMRPSALSYHIALMFLFIFLENLNAFNLLICLTPISNLTIWEKNLLIFFSFCFVVFSILLFTHYLDENLSNAYDDLHI